uniref:Uncharacterized protein n=1 Tax=Gasterosteus aculeatus aculeatus TaxID=481459 RepID=A0AAQ4PS90_GASAC
MCQCESQVGNMFVYNTTNTCTCTLLFRVFPYVEKFKLTHSHLSFLQPPS